MYSKGNLGYKRIHLDHIDSTNEEVKRKLQSQEIPEGLIISTDFQTKGRGQFDRAWESLIGQNITLSVVLRPTFLNIRDQFYLNICSALAVCDTVGYYCDNASIKWPNDIYIQDQKVAGILIENYVQADQIKTSILGIGLNVFQEEWTDAVSNATSLSVQSTTELDKNEIFEKLVENLNQYYNQIKGDKVDMRAAYVDRLYRRERKCGFVVNDQNIEGYIQGIDELGRLTIKQNDEIMAYDHGNIKMVI